MLKTLYFTLALTTLLISNVESSAQSTRSLSGTLTIDVGPVEIDRDIEITVNNHSFVVLPTLAILRPITSSEATMVTMPAGSSQISYAINNIITDPVDYSVSIRCVGCTNDIPTQYYTIDGNAFGLVNAAYIDPEDLPNTLDLTAISRATIKGEIALDKISERELKFKVTIFSEQDAQRVFKILMPITLASDTSSTTYSVTGLSRAIGSDRYRVQLECINCVGISRKTQVFERSLSPNQNHSEINFLATDIPAPSLAPIYQLILD